MSRYPIVELRQYTLRPSQRDVLIELFDREFLETQEAVGMGVLGQFRDLDAPDRFVWLRGFPDMAARADSLEAFYAGPVWKEHGRAANATMLDSDNVLLLHPVTHRWAFPEPRAARPPVGRPAPTSVVLGTLCFADRPYEDTDLFERELYPALAAASAEPFACLSTEYAPNTYPALPVRTGEHVLAWFTSFPGEAELAEHLRDLEPRDWPSHITRTEWLRLAPTSRSLLR